ncbi:MAG: hypothetical protein WCF24_07005 [Acidimicrobiales bacterium]
MRKLPRRLLMWGGAAAIATAGFAYMATNTVSASSAGEGYGPVTGYVTSNTTYDTTCPNNTIGSTCLITDFKFWLAPVTNTDQAPKIVTVSLWAGTSKLITIGNSASGYGSDCTIGSEGTAPTSTDVPTGTYYPVSCVFPYPTGITESQVTALDVAASQ